ncbi:MAG: hypothetical protein KBF83_10015 [Pyrinomonadaceae bacterium]|nr:hypothetical protein [Pyrinomonadaceae bacterium]
MELYLQFGYGMMGHSEALLKEWGRGTVILSPRDLDPKQLVEFGGKLQGLGGAALFDSQFYLPADDLTNLQKHSYWPNNYASGLFWSGHALTSLVEKLIELNDALRTDCFLLPGLFAPSIDDGWLHRQQAVIDESLRLDIPKERLYASVAVSGEVARDNIQIHRILDAAANWEIEGVYLVCEHPNGDYLVTDPNWVANVLDLVSSFRLMGKKVILGYCNQQMLIAATAGANAISSGTWMNVRSFPPDKFRNPDGDSFKQKSTWHYCPTGLSEYKLPFLDIAQKNGVLDLLSSPAELESQYANPLFSGPQPSLIPYSEKTSFRHYLQCLRAQTLTLHHPTFDDTVLAYEEMLSKSEAVLKKLHEKGVTGQNRDFREIVAVNRAALSVLQTGNGPRLRRNWAQL